jgi:aconitate hydratase A / 2-methylisocitrate dehydratase
MFNSQIETTPELVYTVYNKLQSNISEFRGIVNRPLTFSEKILIGHLAELGSKKIF